MAVRLLTARSILVGEEPRLLDGGGLLIEGGRVRRILEGPAAIRRGARESAVQRDLGDVVLTTGLVNAHAHLELSGLRGELPRGTDFGAWVRALIAARARRGARRLALDARAGADRCLRTGTTWVGDIDSTGAVLSGLSRHPLRLRVFRELLDAGDPLRSAAALGRVARALPRRAGRLEGLAPHAPFSVSEGLMREAARLARRRALPVSVHWSETEAEVEWLARGSGPLAALLGASPRASGLELLERNGLLGPRSSLVHGNHPLRGEPARIAAAGATLVHCPGSHRWFAREPFAFERWLRAGVRIALGTDSLASNEDLDLGREMALVRGEHRALGPREVWSWATAGGAAALGISDRAGLLAPGRSADLVCWDLRGAASQPLEALTTGSATVLGVWIGGRRVFGPRG